jgi:hypothetical protein
MHQTWQDKVWSTVSGAGEAGPPELKDDDLLDDLSEMSSLTAKQRLTGFLLSLAMGVTFIAIALSFVPTIALFAKKFAFFFTCGNFFVVASTAFLVGPAAQIKGMFEGHRAQATAIFVGSGFMTMLSAVYWRSTVFSIAFACAQVVAVAWYALSYIPFGRYVVGNYIVPYASMILGPVFKALWFALSTAGGACVKVCCRSSG